MVKNVLGVFFFKGYILSKYYKNHNIFDIVNNGK